MQEGIFLTVEKVILSQLLKSEQYISGEQISRELGVSRTAVWKHINELRQRGYQIESSSKKGYRLIEAADVLDESQIIRDRNGLLGSKIVHFYEIDSTNNYAKKLANEGCPDGTIVIAERQSLGRGRLGREWCSYNSDGIWFSCILRPNIEPESMQVITLAASVAVVEAIEDTLGIVCGIKWPNDIILSGKKLGGILTELSAEPGHVNHIVLGIGINVNQPKDSFTGELEQKAISLRMETGGRVSRALVFNNILRHLDNTYNQLLNGQNEVILDDWRKYSVTLGSHIKLSFRGEEYTGIANNIANDGRLIVKCSDGHVREVTAGEIQIRGIMGYL